MATGELTISRYSASSSREVESVVQGIRGNLEAQQDKKIEETVSEILNQIRREGNTALLRFEQKFDSPKISNASDLVVTPSEFREAYSKVKQEEIRAMKVAYRQIQWLAREQMKRFSRRMFTTPLGFRIEERYVPFNRIGGYIPGGLASYPSTVLMVCAPAKIAGVKQIVLSTPPRKDGRVNEAMLVAANICGVKEVVKAGGAQAIATLAYGTESIRKVDLIAGPGNAFVTEAKRQVSTSGQVLIDSLAGPTELLIIADDRAKPEFIIDDLISQAEHGNKTLCGVVSVSTRLLDAVEDGISSILYRKRLEHIRNAKLFAVNVSSPKLMVEFAQSFAPEHLEAMISSGLRELTNAGLVLLGDFTPCSSTDYIVGTNHILPTGGTSKSSAGLGIENYLKRVTTVKGGRESLRRSSRYISSLATLEGLPNHASAALSRFGRKDN